MCLLKLKDMKIKQFLIKKNYKRFREINSSFMYKLTHFWVGGKLESKEYCQKIGIGPSLVIIPRLTFRIINIIRNEINTLLML